MPTQPADKPTDDRADARALLHEKIDSVLNDPNIARTRGYSPAGELDDDAVVVTVHRVSDATLAKLANGTHDYVPVLQRERGLLRRLIRRRAA